MTIDHIDDFLDYLIKQVNQAEAEVKAAEGVKSNPKVTSTSSMITKIINSTVAKHYTANTLPSKDEAEILATLLHVKDNI